MRRKVFLLSGLIMVALAAAALLLPSWWISRVAGPRCFADVNAVPRRLVGVVLGTSKYIGPGRENHHYRNRIEAAHKLFKAGRVDYLIVSGDHSKYYDEPTTMREDLVRLGVPSARIYLDRSGVRTLDSIVRAGEVFGQREFTVVSQRFHNQRAVFIGSRRGLDVVGYDAPDVGFVHGLRAALRERFARLLAVLDVTIFRRRPRDRGERVVIGPVLATAPRVGKPQAAP